MLRVHLARLARALLPLLGAILAASAPAAAERVHLSVDFGVPPSPEQLQGLEGRDVRILQARGDGRYFASVPTDLGVPLVGLEGVTDVEPWRPEDRLSKELFLLRDPGVAVPDELLWAVDRDPERLRVLLTFFPDVEPARMEEIARSIDPRARRSTAMLFALTSDRESIGRLGKIDEVKRVSLGPHPFLPLNPTARVLVRTDDAQGPDFSEPRPAYQHDGAGVRIGIFDAGIYRDHRDFDEIGETGAPGDSRIHPTRSSFHLHGTHVASIAAGSGFHAGFDNQLFRWRGHGPFARLGDFEDLSADEVADQLASATSQGIDVSNHSYVQSVAAYDEFAALLDAAVRGDLETATGAAIPPRPQVWGAGNNGLRKQCWLTFGCAGPTGWSSTFTSAKNTISVGSVDTSTGRLSTFSSLGPTIDGRIKPDLVAPGCFDSYDGKIEGIYAASAGSQGYWPECGTSMAAPVVAGILALMMDACRKSPQCTEPTLPSTWKAMLVHTAKDLEKTAPYRNDVENPDTVEPILYGKGPDFATGFGLVQAPEATALVTKTDRWKEASLGGSGESEKWCLGVARRGVKVTLAWDDSPGDETKPKTEQPKLVNDLDLRVFSPSGEEFEPWTLDPRAGQDGAPIAGTAQRGDDVHNNVEMVTAPSARGWWRVVVGAKSVGPAPQRYSLVASHPLLPAPCPDGEVPESEEPVVTPEPTPEPHAPPAPPVLLSHEILLPNRRFTPEEIDRGFLASLGGPEPREAIVQFDSIPTREQRTRLARSGVELQSYLEGGAYRARLAPGTRIEGLSPRVRWVGPLQPRDKVSAPLWEAIRRDERVAAIVYFDPEMSGEETRALLEHRGLDPIMPWGVGTAQTAELTREQVLDLASSHAVRFLEHLPDRLHPLSR